MDSTPLRKGSSTTSAVGHSTGRSKRQRRTSTTRGPSTLSTMMGQSSTAIVAIAEGSGHARGEVGFAAMDVRRPELLIGQFSDTTTYAHTFTKLQISRPAEIIVPDTVCDSTNITSLCRLLQEQYSEGLKAIKRSYFNESIGLTYIQEKCLESELPVITQLIENKYYCLSAAAALLKYIEFVQNIVFARRSLKVVFQGSEKTTMIDTTTSLNLELMHSLRHPGSTQNTLYGAVNQTKTILGARLLRSELLQPPCDLATIQGRLEVVNEIYNNRELYESLESILARFIDVDHLITACVQQSTKEDPRVAEMKIMHGIYLKHTLELVAPLKEALSRAEGPLFRIYAESLEDPRFESILTNIHEILNIDVHYEKRTLQLQTQKCWAVRTGLSGELDIARRTYKETLDDMEVLVGQLTEVHQIPLRTGFSKQRGFFIQTEMSNAKNLPPVFQQVNWGKKTVSMTTSDLRQMNHRLNESQQDIYLAANQVMDELLHAIRQHIGCLYNLTEMVGTLDMLRGFAEYAIIQRPITGNIATPEFSDTLAIQQGVHPILSYMSERRIVANDTFLHEGSSFCIITGPNMSGKSMYLRQVALLQIMAQIGCPVPAVYANFRIADQIFSRIGCDDKLETNSSTFTLECRETNYIIQNATDNSLIIIDELGRGTSTLEGIGFCHAVSEYLLSLKAFTLLTTHFTEITALNIYPNVTNWHFLVTEQENQEDTRLEYTHELVEGITENHHYGIHLASKSAIPESIIKRAKEISEELRKEWEARRDSTANSAERVKKRAIHELACSLIQAARIENYDFHSLKPWLKELQTACRSACALPEA